MTQKNYLKSPLIEGGSQFSIPAEIGQKLNVKCIGYICTFRKGDAAKRDVDRVAEEAKLAISTQIDNDDTAKAVKTACELLRIPLRDVLTQAVYLQDTATGKDFVNFVSSLSAGQTVEVECYQPMDNNTKLPAVWKNGQGQEYPQKRLRVVKVTDTDGTSEVHSNSELETVEN